MVRRVELPLILAVSVIAIATLAGCSAGGLPGSAAAGGGSSSGSTSGATTGSSTNPPPKTGGTGSSGASGSSFTVPKTCLSAAAVSALVGAPEYGPTATADSTSLTCVYETATKDGGIVDIEPSHGLSAALFTTEVSKKPPSGTTAAAAPGFGDAAVTFSGSDYAGIYVLVGQNTINIGVPGSTVAGVEALAKALLGQ